MAFNNDNIEAYLRDELLTPQREAFERALAEDEKLQRKTDNLRRVLLAADLADLEERRQRLRQPAGPKPPAGGRRPWGLLLLLGLLGLAAWVLWPPPASPPEPTAEPAEVPAEVAPAGQPPQDTAPPRSDEPPGAPTPNEPVAPMEEPPPEPGNTNPPEAPVFAARMETTLREMYRLPDELRELRTTKDTTGSPENLAQQALLQGRYGEAIDRLTPLRQASPDDETLRRYLAHAYFGDGRYDRSAELFRELLRGSEPEAAQWYLALALLGQQAGPDPAALALLGQIGEEEFHPYRRLARRLLAELE